MVARIPFDALVLAAVSHELQAWVGARVQKVWQPDPESVVLELYAGQVTWLWIGWDSEFTRAYLSPRKPRSMGESPTFCMALRARLEDGLVERVRQMGRDRILEITVANHKLVIELVGKHANVILVGPDGNIVSAGRMAGPAKSKRPVLPGRMYEPPPTVAGASPFLARLVAAGADVAAAESVYSSGAKEPVFVPGLGAYPISVRALGYDELHRDSISIALANYYDVAIPARILERRRTALSTQLRRVLLARETAIGDLLQAQDAVARADQRQRMAELILTYQHQVKTGDLELQAYDYDGSEIVIPLLPDKSPVENANILFDKARRSKARKDVVRDQLARHTEERDALLILLDRLEMGGAREVDACEEEADRRRWRNLQKPAVAKEERPYGGKRIREMIGPGGWTILVGENAEANDYLTLRVAKPDDWWLHVRGAVSGHVVVPSRRQPEKVPREVLEFAALVAAQHSGQKHSSYVPVDYTMKRYVRKVRSAPLGTVLYTHEKTIYVDPAR